MNVCVRPVTCIFLLLFNIITAWGQMPKFLDKGNVWIFHVATGERLPAASPDDYRVCNPVTTTYTDVTYKVVDTIVVTGGKSYSVIRCNEAGFACELWLREDTVSKKVFAQGRGFGHLNVTDTGEFVYMDFSLSKGDSFTMPIIEPSDSKAKFTTHKVMEVDSIVIDKKAYKRLYIYVFQGGMLVGNYFVTDGIGPSSGPELNWNFESYNKQLRMLKNNRQIWPAEK